MSTWRWRQVAEALREAAAQDPETLGLVSKRKEGHPRRSALSQIAAAAAADMVRFGGEFGLSPASRARISAGVGFEPPRSNKFDGLLAE
jgi:phage terminase small subunit